MERRNKILHRLFAIFLVVCQVQCQLTFQETVFVDQENPNRCYDSEIDTYFDLHSVWWRPNQCLRLTCQLGSSPSIMTIVGERCQEYDEAPPDCRVTSNQYVLFPGCCPKLDCKSPIPIPPPPDSSEITEFFEEEPPPIIEEPKPVSEEIFPPISSEEIVCEGNVCPPGIELVEQVPFVDQVSSEKDKFVDRDPRPPTPTPGEVDVQPDDAIPTQPLPADVDGGVEESGVTNNTQAPEEQSVTGLPDQEGAISNVVEETGNELGDNVGTLTTTEEPYNDTVTENKPALDGYETHSTGTYKFYTMMVTWSEAKLICEADGTHLAIVNSEEESKVLKQMFSIYPFDFWKPQYQFVVFASLGFHDMDQEGKYVTINGDPLNSTGFTRFWQANEPNNLGAVNGQPGEDCGSIHRNGGLNDFFCLLHLPFICEQ